METEDAEDELEVVTGGGILELVVTGGGVLDVCVDDVL